MNKIYSYLSAVLLLLVFGGCDSMFDNELPPHDLVGENAITNESSAEVALNGVYSYIGGYGTMSAYYISDNEFRTGLLDPKYYYRSKMEEDQLPQLQLQQDNNSIETPWKVGYKLVNAASNFIYYTEKVSDDAFGGNRKTEMLAEARFLRGFAHAFLLRKFGYFWDMESRLGTIIRMEPSSLSNNNKARSTVKESYEKIFEDLDYAIQYGPAYRSKYIICATAAKAFKADILMNRGAAGDYAEAIRLADEVIGSSEFGMEDTYADIFKNGYTSKELLFTRFLKEPPTMSDNVGSLLKMFGGGTYQPTSAYLAVFQPNDPRYEVTFDSIEYTRLDGTKYKMQNWKKHYVENGDCPMYYMRVAQMYLIKAEAMLWNGSEIKDVVDVLNVVRNRAGATPLKASDYPDRESLMNEIFNENVREIGMENGACYYLAVRMKIGGKRLLKTWNDNYEKDDQLCFPIPLAELQHNSKVDQKPL